MIIYYNPDCSKCREVTGLLEQNNCEIVYREYLKEPPTVEELRDLIKKLNCSATDIVRKSEPLYLEKYERLQLTETQWLETLSENPILIERPIVIDGNSALVGRPPSLVLRLIHEDGIK